jgi:hypothetical protein
MNERHPLDIISLVFGILFLGISVPVLLMNTPLDIDLRWALPVTVIVVGLLILGSALLPKRNTVSALETTAGQDF